MSGRGPKWIGGPKFPEYAVTLSGKFDEECAYAEVGDTKYTDAAEIAITKWHTLTVHVSATTEGYNDQCKVTLNGAVVLTGAGDYELIVTDQAAIEFIKDSHSAGNIHYECNITMG